MNLQTMKNALIIGGSTGIGLDAAKRLGLRGATVTIAGRDTGKLETAAAAIKEAGSPKVITKVLDLYDRAQVDDFYQKLASGTIFNYLVNSAGYFSPTPFLKHTRENFHQYHGINESLLFSLRRWRNGW